MLLAFRRVVTFRRHDARPISNCCCAGNRTQMPETVKLRFRACPKFAPLCGKIARHEERYRPRCPISAAARSGRGFVLVEQEIALAARAADRDPASVKLVAVTKTVPAAIIEEAIAAGQRVFGENRVQEAHAKWPALKAAPSRYRASSHRAAAIEQGARGGRPVRRDRDRRPAQARPRSRRGNGATLASDRVSSCRSTPARNRKRPACCPPRPMRSSRCVATTLGSPSTG